MLVILTKAQYFALPSKMRKKTKGGEYFIAVRTGKEVEWRPVKWFS